ncbi:MAG: T9SS type A sorting domain-containing protein [Bacteroidales bacterium]|nr:T9SS type A sorting domain-containing protein [Bacteroidales bacterium]
MKKIVILPLFILLTVWLSAQEVVSSAGETQTVPGYEVSWTLGEAVIETVSDGTSVLTQGFHQSKIIVTAIDELLVSGLEIKVYPNPTAEFVNIHLSNIEEEPVYSLFDFSGKLLESKAISNTETRVNLNEYASGTYVLRLNQNFGQPLQTFKIMKK